MAEIILHGIKSCDTVRKARAWLNAAGIPHRFHDVRVDGLDAATLDGWIAEVGWEVLLNRASTSFRALPHAETAGLDATRARALMLDEPTMIKRPVLQTADALIVGFSPERYEVAFGRK